MKKLLSLAFVLLLAASSAMAAETVEKKNSKPVAKKVEKKKEEKKSEKSSASNMGVETGSWVIQLQGDLSLLVTDTSNSVTYKGIGFGAEGSVAYAFNKNFSLGLMTGLQAFDLDATGLPGTDGASWSYAPLEIVAQYTFSGQGLRPYILFGAGFAVNTLTVDQTGTSINQGFSEVDPIVSPGIGVAFDLSDKASFFVQTRLDLTFQSTDWKDFLSTGSGMGDGVFLPIQVGVNFSAI